jgi:Ca-activated chloride channel family protein
MTATDYQPTRLGRARQLLQDVIWQARGDRVGVMAFAGDAVVVCPLTLDSRMARIALDHISVNTVRTQGTDIAHAINTARSIFDQAGRGERVLLLLTDGECHSGRLPEAIEKAAQANIRIFAVGIGSTEGGPIPTATGFLEDNNGQVVNSRLNLEALIQAAQKTGGRAVKANPTGDAEIRTIMNDIAGLQSQGQQEQTIRIHHERFFWFLLPALALLLIDSLLTVGWKPSFFNRLGSSLEERSRGQTPPASAASGSTTLLLLITIASGLTWQPNSVSAFIGEARRENERGLEAWRMGNYATASEHFRRATQADPTDPRLRLNEATARRAAGETTSARDLFLSVYDPTNPEITATARYNLGTADHRDIQRELKPLLEGPALSELPPEMREEVQSKMQRVQGDLLTAAGRYREALLAMPTDQQARENLELALRQLQNLQEKMELPPDEPPPPQPQNQPDQPEESQQSPPDENPPQPNDQQQPGTGSDQDNEPNSNDAQDTKGQSGDPADRSPQNDRQDQGGQGQEQPPAQATPTPTPAPQGQAPQPDPNSQDPSEQGGKGEPQPGQMSDRDVERLLNSLPEENRRALQRFLTGQPGERPDMEKPW